MKLRTTLMNFIPLMAIPAAVLLPPVGKLFTPYTSWILGVMLFFSFLGLGVRELIKVAKHPLQPIYVSLVILVVTPLIIIPIMQRFFPEYLLGSVIFMLLPAAVSSPAVAAIYGGNLAVSAVNAVATNLLCPLTIPFFLVLFMSAAVKVSAGKILLQLATMIVIPFILGLLADRYLPGFVEKTKKSYRLINLLLLFLLFFAILAPYTKEFMANLTNTRLILAVLIAHLVLYFFAKLTILHSPDQGKRIGIVSNMMFLNVGLGIVLVQNYFGPMEMLFLIYCEIMWVFLVAFFKYLR